MVVREDGTKWACSSCLKGHRVSGCNHTDRELKLVPKKGRPVTQCHHCRQERKKRSAHVKCDCADDKTHHTKDKCIHLREAEDRAKSAGFHDDSHSDHDAIYLATVAEEQGCCCHHGGKCSCALLQRKDSTDDDGMSLPRHKPAVSKPRLEATRSDGSLTVFTNGHHKPVHRKNHAAHECGMPYKIPLPRSKTDQEIAIVARRSVDSLALDQSNNMDYGQASSAFPFPRRQSRSENLSPRLADLLAKSDGLTASKLNMVDFSDLEPVQTNDTTASATGESFPAFDMSGLNPDGWPAMSIENQMLPDNNPFGVWPTSVDASGLVQPALTAASSGTQSEIDEIPSIDDIYIRGMPSIEETTDLEFDAAANTSSPQANRRSLPPNFFGNLDFNMPNIDDEWQQTEDTSNMFDDKATQPFVFNDPWQVNNQQPQQPYVEKKQQQAATGRPIAHSVGASAAPGNDVMKQLFPGMDLDGDADSANSAAATQRIHEEVVGVSPNGQEMSDVDGQVDDFSAGPWSDGSLAVPNDAFGAGFDADFDAQNNQAFEAQMWNSQQ